MRIIALGDTHGHSTWKKILSKEKSDKIIFIGDYFDSINISGEKQIQNFKDIIYYKRCNKNSVVLLMGNHDFHYLDMNERYSGFQDNKQFYIREELNNAIKENLMEMCYIHNDLLFTHAGVTKTWLKSCGYTGEEPLDIFINDVFKYQPRKFKFTVGKNQSPYGDDITQSPIWVRPASLLKDKVDNYTCVVGHTQQDKLKMTKEIVLIDTIGTSGEYLVYDNGVLTVKKVS